MNSEALRWLELAKNLGEEIQKSDLYIKMRMYEQLIESDEHLQQLREDYNIKVIGINVESEKENPNYQKIAKLTKEKSDIYDEIFSDPNMRNYKERKDKFDSHVRSVMSIIKQYADGKNPSYENQGLNLDDGCTGDCGSCGQCY